MFIIDDNLEVVIRATQVYGVGSLGEDFLFLLNGLETVV